MTLKLIKIEEGVCRGNVVHHEFIKKTPAEIKKQLDSLKNKRELKEKRKKEQEANVKRKAEKRGEILPEDAQNKAQDGEKNEGEDFKDEGEDTRVLGKRGREEKSVNRTGRTDKKAILKSKSVTDRSHSKRSTSVE